MALLAAATWDPATAEVAQTLSVLKGMTAISGTNLRCTFTAPTSERVMWRVRCNIGGGIAMPGILLGVLSGATVLARAAPDGFFKSAVVAADNIPREAVGIITGLTSGAAYTVDAAYGVEIIVASMVIRIGGPNDAVTSNAYGSAGIEIWDV